MNRRAKLLSDKEVELNLGNENLMRESEFLTSEFFKKEGVKDQLHRLRETLSFKHSDQSDRLEDRTKNMRAVHDVKTSKLMEDLTEYSKLLEDTSKGSMDGAIRNDELKQEFRIFYDTYQQEELEFKTKCAEVDEKIQALVLQKEEVEKTGEKDRLLLGPLKDKLKTAQQKEIALKETLQQQAAKFEMFQGLVTESNGKFTKFKVDMESNSASTKSLSLENAELRKKIAQLTVSIEPIEIENKIAGDAVKQAQKQIEQLNLLIERLKQ